MSEDLLKSPCLFCGYNASGYWQSDTHDTSCVWHGLGGMENRMKLLPFTIKRLQKTNAELLEALENLVTLCLGEHDEPEELINAREAITNAKQGGGK